MNGLDLIILVALAGGLVIGLRSGLIKQVVSFAGLVAGFLLALRLMHGVGAMAEASLGISPDVAPLLGFVLVFLGVQLLVLAVIRLMEAVVGALKLTVFNRVLGGAVGAFKAAVILSVVFVVLGFFAVPSEETKGSSALYEPVSTVLPAAWDALREVFPEVRRLSERFGNRLRGPFPDAEPE